MSELEEHEEEVTVVAVFQAIKGREKDLEKELMALIPSTRREPGCINYDLHRSLEDPTLYMFHENWTSKKALDEHLEMPYLKEFLKKSDKFVAKPAQISLYKMISNKS